MFILLTSTTTPPGRKEVPSISRSLYRSEFALLQFSTEHGQMLGVAIACGQFFAVFHTVHFVPETGYIRWNGLKQAKRLTVGVDSKHAGLALTV
jgi:hypothetical protein